VRERPEDEAVQPRAEPEILPPQNTELAAQLLTYGLPGAALLIAIIALTVALLK